MKKVVMVFPKDMKVDGKVIAKANEPTEIELLNEGSLTRWILRGGVVVESKKEENVFTEKKYKKKFESKPEEKIEE
jgi:hypothetical protein